jgi:hypothetical protein
MKPQFCDTKVFENCIIQTSPKYAIKWDKQPIKHEWHITI